MALRPHICTSLLAMAGALALAGCGAQTNTANDQVANDAAVANDMSDAALAPADLPLPAGDTAVVEDADTAPAIQVVTVPTPAPAISADDAAPLSDAVAAERLIAAGRGIKRVQQADGWAWMQDGRIIRTASADGHRVSYFRHGATTPYLVQQDGRSYSYANGRISREYDDRGRPRAPDAQHKSEAQRFADQARAQRDRAEQASKTAPHIDRSHGHGNDGHPASHPTPSPTATSGRDGRGNDDHAGPGTDRHGDNAGRASTGHGSPDRDASGRGSSRGDTDHRDRDARGDDSQANQSSPRR